MAIAILVASGSLGQASEQTIPRCDAPAEIESRFQPGGLILMGEIHGTAEAPARVGAVVCDALKRVDMVSVGLELPRDQVEPLAVYLASNGDQIATAQLLHSPFWMRSFQDGRTSIAMLGLVERLRGLKQHYPHLVVFALEDDAGLPSESAKFTRDRRMAARVRVEHESRPQALVLTLSGNIHSRLKPMPTSPDELAIAPPMGTFLTDLTPRSVKLVPTGGTAWTCTPDCGVHALSEPGKLQGRTQPVYRELGSAEPYTEEWLIGPSHASRPAVH
jgi:hypothetical protein